MLCSRTVLSLFDYSGEWSRPYADAGWNVLQMDIKHGDDVREFSAKWLLENVLQGFTVDVVLAAPPCTDFARSGATHWATKDLDGRTALSVYLVYQTLRTIDFLKPAVWAIENPIGRIARLVPELGSAACAWDPCDYAGWNSLTEGDFVRLAALREKLPAGEKLTADDVGFVKTTNAYTKRTLLWGNFRAPERRRVEPVRCTTQGSWLQGLGGKSERTKAERSMTPSGFAQAFFEANKIVEYEE